jgi:hypothetical protein
MAKWLEDHVAAIGPFKLEPWNVCLMSDKMETGWGQLGGLVEHLEGKSWESVVAILRFSVWYPSPVLVKDRGVGTREQVSNISIACWLYGPNKLM